MNIETININWDQNDSVVNGKGIGTQKSKFIYYFLLKNKPPSKISLNCKKPWSQW